MLQLKEICFYNVGFAHPDFLAAQFAGHGILNGTLNGKDHVIGTRTDPLQLLAASIGIPNHLIGVVFYRRPLYCGDVGI